MALRYRILPEAKQELIDAAAYHEEQREGLALKLFAELDAIVERARELPASGRRVELGSGHAVHCFQMRRFRYSVFAAISGNHLVVVGVSHHKRRPEYWVDRLKNLPP